MLHTAERGKREIVTGSYTTQCSFKLARTQKGSKLLGVIFFHSLTYPAHLLEAMP